MPTFHCHICHARVSTSHMHTIHEWMYEFLDEVTRNKVHEGVKVCCTHFVQNHLHRFTRKHPPQTPASTDSPHWTRHNTRKPPKQRTSVAPITNNKKYSRY